MAEPRPRVKICGTTSVRDAVHAAEVGADALGFIFAPVSKRLVTPQVAREAGLSVGPTVARVGVFLNQGLGEVLRLSEAARVSSVQLHGALLPGFVQTVAGYYPVLRVVRPADLQAEAAAWTGQPGVTLMLDAPEPGGGVPLNWAELRPLFPPGAWLAGGLGPHNVREAASQLAPAGVDAVSRLEASPGVKNPQAVKAFVDAVRGL
ncbi:phosphoribosylanthranilate isomerase [Deinococcus reticulitermitis]|uniref:N-(5'-phosphoribosyl)anthranilate isomerase n=1 Tax=Deinococcus reticulitermitis TaxID=856736 RepID=A0A1H6UXQ3_9DEIO|nr:phosphoribosylanthranilate isomerase [Deinococcus reticulitermitis]SEI92795.1 phosphoribosylanthranilate isomerase [Deinococcus reticulitermitis]